MFARAYTTPPVRANFFLLYVRDIFVGMIVPRLSHRISKKFTKIKRHATRMLTQEEIRYIEKHHVDFPGGWNGSPQDFITVSLPLGTIE